MYAHKLHVNVAPDHRLSIDLPADFPPGPAEVIVLAQVRAAREVTVQEGGADDLEEAFARRFPRDPMLGPVIFHEDPTAPLAPEDWPETSGDDEAAS